MMPGMIMLWHGSVETIPSGWHLCDGTMGTPDLRDKFVPCAGGSYNPGDTGGSASHVHPFIGDGHAHDLLSGTLILTDLPNGTLSYVCSSSPASGTTDSIDGRPPFHALCYIMKL